MKKKRNSLKIFSYYLISSLITAIAGYYFLLVFSNQNYVFGGYFRMHSYHHENPIQFIAIPCFIFAIIATLIIRDFKSKHIVSQLLLTVTVILITLFLSMPIGGILYFYYDMKAGFFPTDSLSIMISRGVSMGVSTGWLIILYSLPYNILGAIAAYFILKLVSSKTES